MLSTCYHGRNDIKTNANDGRSVTFFPGHISRNPKPNMHSAFTSHPGLRTTYDKPSVAKFNLRYLCSIFLGRARPYRTSHYHPRLLPSKGRHCQFSVKKQHLGHIVYFAKNLSPVPWDKCVRWFKIYQIFSNFRGAVVLPRSRKNFFRSEIWQIGSFTRHDLKEDVNQENMISIFRRSILVRSLLRSRY